MEEHAEEQDAGHVAHEGGSHDHMNPIDLGDPANFKAGLWALGIFIVLVLVLKKLAWGPIIEGLNARESRIADSLEKAEAIEKATAELAETNRKLMEDAQKEAQGIVAASRETAQNTANDLIAKANSEIEASRERGKRELALEVEKAKAELRSEAVTLTMDAASKLLGRSLTGDDHKRLVEEALRDADQVAG